MARLRPRHPAPPLELYRDDEDGTVTLAPADAEGVAIMSQWLTSDVAIDVREAR